MLFKSFPDVTLKKIVDVDTISEFKDKCQFNFDQIYLNYINKAIKGEKGDPGLPGLSIKGDQGDPGEKGTIIHIDSVVDGDIVVDPEHREGDLILSPDGSYFSVVDDGNGNLIYSLEFSPDFSQYLISQLDFTAQGVISQHKTFGGSEGNLLLALRDGSSARYYRTIMGSNIAQSPSVDTLTLVNILDGASASTSTPQKQLSLRYRDVEGGSESLSSFDFIYEVDTDIEYRYIGDPAQTLGLIKDTTNPTEGSAIVDIARFFITGGGSPDWKTSDTNNSFSISKDNFLGTWILDTPSDRDLQLTSLVYIDKDEERVGIGNVSPEYSLDIDGTFDVNGVFRAIGSDTEIRQNHTQIRMFANTGVGINLLGVIPPQADLHVGGDIRHTDTTVDHSYTNTTTGSMNRSIVLSLPNVNSSVDMLYNVKITVMAIRTNGAGTMVKIYYATLKALANVTGVQLVGSETIVHEEMDGSGGDISTDLNLTGSNPVMRIFGTSGQNWNWRIDVERRIFEGSGAI